MRALRHPSLSIWLIAGGALGLGLLAVLAGATIAHAVLVAWVFWIGVPAGSMVLLMILGVTGGRWDVVARPVLAPAALAMPIIAMGIIPILLMLPAVYGWAGDDVAARREVVEETFLNAPGFALRAILILVLWSILAWLSALTRPTPTVAALGLIAYAATVFFASVDWVMSTDAAWASTAFPALIAVSQIASALAVLGAVQLFGAGEAEEDIAGLLLAALLGVTYLAFVQGLVMWSGNIPDDVEWYVDRLHPKGAALLIVAFLIGAAIPFLMLIVERVRRSRALTSLAALLVLVGLMLHLEWILMPTDANGLVWLPSVMILVFGLLFWGIVEAFAGITGRRGAVHV